MSSKRQSFLSGLFGSSSSTVKTIASATGAQPLVRTVQAVEGILQAGELIGNANETATNLNGFIPKASNAVDRIDAFIPSMQVMTRSFCDSVKIITTFSAVASAAGIGANIVLSYQGVQALDLIAARLKEVATSLAAQTAMLAQKEFAQYVYDMVRERLGQTADDSSYEHWFFVYHPDNDWYPKFFILLEGKPLGPSFCGYTNQIDTAFTFMLAARRYVNERERRARKQGKYVRPVMLHLLIPAYQPIVIAEALKIPEEIGEFQLEGRVNSNKAFVWLNLPEDQKRYLVDIGHWEPPVPGWWETAMATIGVRQQPFVLKAPRTLGTSQQLMLEREIDPLEKDDALSEITSEASSVGALELAEPEKEAKRRRKTATPLHQRDRERRDRERKSSKKREKSIQ